MKVSHKGSLTFYVQSFNSTDPTLGEFVVLENGRPTNRDSYSSYSFTVDAPAPYGRSIDFTLTANHTFKLFPGLYLRGRDSITIYVNRNPINNEYAGPITIVSSNSGQNPGYGAVCERANSASSSFQGDKGNYRYIIPQKLRVAYIDTNRLWTFSSPKSVVLRKSGPRAVVLNEELLNAGIIPTNGLSQLIDQLNSNLSGREHYESGTIFKLPVFREPDKDQINNMELQIQKDTSLDETQNQLISAKAEVFSNVLNILKELNANGEYMELLRKSERLLNKIVFNLPDIKFKRYHAVMISTEVEKLTNYVIRMAARNTLSKINNNYLSSFIKYIEGIVNPYYYTKTGKPQASIIIPLSTSGLSSVRNKFIFTSAHAYREANQDFVFVIHVFIPISIKGGTSYDYKDSLRHYWVYVLDPFQYDNLNEALMNMEENKKNGLSPTDLNNIISKTDLDGTGARCDAPASVTSKSIDFGKSYHFIVLSADSNKIVIHNYIENTAEIPRHSADKKVPELYGIGLYQDYKSK